MCCQEISTSVADGTNIHGVERGDRVGVAGLFSPMQGNLCLSLHRVGMVKEELCHPSQVWVAQLSREGLAGTWSGA